MTVYKSLNRKDTYLVTKVSHKADFINHADMYTITNNGQYIKHATTFLWYEQIGVDIEPVTDPKELDLIKLIHKL